MDYSASLEQLETASQILLAAPNLVTKEQRSEAENILLTFRKTRNAFGLCKFILERSHTELVVFETADVLRNNLIQDWTKIPVDEIQLLNNHIIQLQLSTTNFSFSVQRRLAGVVALIVKHQSLINNGKQRTQLVTHLENAMNTSGHSLIVACCILDGLLAEHQFAVNALDASLTYEMHYAAKKDFENTDLLRIFQFCLRFLTNYEHNPMKQRDLDHVLKILENILYWNFSKNNLPKRVAGVIEMETTPTFKPPSSWSDTIKNSAFIPVFFDIHVKVRGDENFVLRTINLMIQLVSMHGPLLTTKETRVEFLSRILPQFTHLLELPNKLPIEIFGLSDVIRKILLFNRAMLLSAVSPPVFEAFIKAVGAFSCHVIQQSALEESSCSVDDRVYRDSLTRVLEAWMNILTDTENVPKNIVQPVVTSIFENYLRAHLSPPEGFRQPVSNSSNDTESDEDGDTTQFRDQLQPAGIFGRFILPHSVPFITQLLNFKCQALQAQIQLVANQSAPRESLDVIYEDLHWGILIAGHIIAFDGLGETNLIPAEINDYSLASGSNPDASAIAVQNAFQMIPIPDGNAVDPIIRLVCCVIALSEMERRVMESNLGHLLSPELASNVMWFFHRFCQSYFNVNEEYYASISPSFISAWGIFSPTAVVAQTAFFRRIREDFIRFNGEVDVMKQCINLLLALVDSNKKAENAIQSPELGPLVQLTNQVGPGQYQMPSEVYRKYVRAIISVGSFCEDEVTREQYWDQIIGPLTVRFSNFLSLSPAERHRDEVRLELVYVLSGFIGSAMSSHSRIATPLYRKIGTIVSQCGAILDAYHNYVDIVELCLELVIELAKRSLSYLSQSDSYGVYEAAMSVVKSYALHATGRTSTEKTAEEDTYNDLVLLIDMLSCLLAKDFLDLSPDSVSSYTSTPVTASDVSLQGLSIVLPLMNADLLQYPNLSGKYFRLIAFLSELHPDKVMALPPPMIQGLYHSVQLGLQGQASETFSSCCEFISSMAQHIARQGQQATPSAELCKPFLKIFLEMILSQKIGKDCIPGVSTALFALISAFSEVYRELATQLISSRTEEETRANLNAAFTKLTDDLNMNAGGDRLSRAHFRDRLDTFIFNARGCLD